MGSSLDFYAMILLILTKVNEPNDFTHPATGKSLPSHLTITSYEPTLQNTFGEPLVERGKYWSGPGVGTMRHSLPAAVAVQGTHHSMKGSDGFGDDSP